MKRAKIYTEEFYTVLNNQIKFTNEAIAFWQSMVEKYPNDETAKKRLETFKARAKELDSLPK